MHSFGKEIGLSAVDDARERESACGGRRRVDMDRKTACADSILVLRFGEGWAIDSGGRRGNCAR